MFHYADEKAAEFQSTAYSQLENAIDSLEKTANSWFDGGSVSIQNRRNELSRAANLAYRVASSYDEEDGADIHVLASALVAQEKELQSFQYEIADSEYSTRVGSNGLRFSEPLADESRTSARLETDWDLFMAIEPREFVASNSDADAEELKTRAFSFMDQVTSGHGLGRSAKVSLTQEFISRTLDAQKTDVGSIEKVAEVSSHDDSALFF